MAKFIIPEDIAVEGKYFSYIGQTKDGRYIYKGLEDRDQEIIYDKNELSRYVTSAASLKKTSSPQSRTPQKNAAATKTSQSQANGTYSEYLKLKKAGKVKSFAEYEHMNDQANRTYSEYLELKKAGIVKSFAEYERMNDAVLRGLKLNARIQSDKRKKIQEERKVHKPEIVKPAPKQRVIKGGSPILPPKPKKQVYKLPPASTNLRHTSRDNAMMAAHDKAKVSQSAVYQAFRAAEKKDLLQRQQAAAVALKQYQKIAPYELLQQANKPKLRVRPPSLSASQIKSYQRQLHEEQLEQKMAKDIYHVKYGKITPASQYEHMIGALQKPVKFNTSNNEQIALDARALLYDHDSIAYNEEEYANKKAAYQQRQKASKPSPWANLPAPNKDFSKGGDFSELFRGAKWVSPKRVKMHEQLGDEQHVYTIDNERKEGLSMSKILNPNDNKFIDDQLKSWAEKTFAQTKIKPTQRDLDEKRASLEIANKAAQTGGDSIHKAVEDLELGLMRGILDQKAKAAGQDVKQFIKQSGLYDREFHDTILNKYHEAELKGLSYPERDAEAILSRLNLDQKQYTEGLKDTGRIDKEGKAIKRSKNEVLSILQARVLDHIRQVADYGIAKSDIIIPEMPIALELRDQTYAFGMIDGIAPHLSQFPGEIAKLDYKTGRNVSKQNIAQQQGYEAMLEFGGIDVTRSLLETLPRDLNIESKMYQIQKGVYMQDGRNPINLNTEVDNLEAIQRNNIESFANQAFLKNIYTESTKASIERAKTLQLTRKSGIAKDGPNMITKNLAEGLGFVFDDGSEYSQNRVFYAKEMLEFINSMRTSHPTKYQAYVERIKDILKTDSEDAQKLNDKMYELMNPDSVDAAKQQERVEKLFNETLNNPQNSILKDQWEQVNKEKEELEASGASKYKMNKNATKRQQIYDSIYKLINRKDLSKIELPNTLNDFKDVIKVPKSYEAGVLTEDPNYFGNAAPEQGTKEDVNLLLKEVHEHIDPLGGMTAQEQQFLAELDAVGFVKGGSGYKFNPINVKHEEGSIIDDASSAHTIFQNLSYMLRDSVNQFDAYSSSQRYSPEFINKLGEMVLDIRSRKNNFAPKKTDTLSQKAIKTEAEGFINNIENFIGDHGKDENRIANLFASIIDAPRIYENFAGVTAEDSDSARIKKISEKYDPEQVTKYLTYAGLAKAFKEGGFEAFFDYEQSDNIDKDVISKFMYEAGFDDDGNSLMRVQEAYSEQGEINVLDSVKAMKGYFHEIINNDGDISEFSQRILNLAHKQLEDGEDIKNYFDTGMLIKGFVPTYEFDNELYQKQKFSTKEDEKVDLFANPLNDALSKANTINPLELGISAGVDKKSILNITAEEWQHNIDKYRENKNTKALNKIKNTLGVLHKFRGGAYSEYGKILQSNFPKMQLETPYNREELESLGNKFIANQTNKHEYIAPVQNITGATEEQILGEMLNSIPQTTDDIETILKDAGMTEAEIWGEHKGSSTMTQETVAIPTPSQPMCSMCHTVVADGDDGLCSICREKIQQIVNKQSKGTSAQTKKTSQRSKLTPTARAKTAPTKRANNVASIKRGFDSEYDEVQWYQNNILKLYGARDKMTDMPSYRFMDNQINDKQKEYDQLFSQSKFYEDQSMLQNRYQKQANPFSLLTNAQKRFEKAVRNNNPKDIYDSRKQLDDIYNIEDQFGDKVFDAESLKKQRGTNALSIRLKNFQEAYENLQNGVYADLDSMEAQVKEATQNILNMGTSHGGIFSDEFLNESINKITNKGSNELKEQDNAIKEAMKQIHSRNELLNEAFKIEHFSAGKSKTEQKLAQKQADFLRRQASAYDGVEIANGKVTYKTNIQTGEQKTLELSQDSQDKAAAMMYKENESAARKHAAIAGQKVVPNSLLAKVMSGFSLALQRAIDYGLAYGLIAKFKQAIQVVVKTTQQLDKIATDIQIVTGESRKSVNEMMSGYTQIAKDLGRTTEEVAKSANEFLRMGYAGTEAAELITQAMTLSTLGMIDSSEAAKYLTAAIKGYGVAVEDVSKIVDMATALDMAYATSAGQILQAMSRTSASARLAKVDMENLQAMTTVVIETSQKSAESVGEAFKTAFARFGNVKAGKVDFSGLTDETEGINDIESALKKVGIQIRDSNGQWRSYQTVIDEIGASWKNWGDLERNLVTTAMFGTRQREVGTILLDNYDEYQNAVKVASDSEGTAAIKMLAYEKSLEAAIKRRTIAWEEFTQSMDVTKFLTTMNNVLGSIIKNLKTIALVGGGLFALLKLPQIAGMARNSFVNISDFSSRAREKAKSFISYDAEAPLKGSRSLKIGTGGFSRELQASKEKEAGKLLDQEVSGTKTLPSAFEKLKHSVEMVSTAFDHNAKAINNNTIAQGGELPVDNMQIRDNQIHLMTKLDKTERSNVMAYLQSGTPLVNDIDGLSSDTRQMLEGMSADDKQNLLGAMKKQQPTKGLNKVVGGALSAAGITMGTLGGGMLGKTVASRTGGDESTGQSVGAMLGGVGTALAAMAGPYGPIVQAALGAITLILGVVIKDWNKVTSEMIDAVGDVKLIFDNFEEYNKTIKDYKDQLSKGLVTAEEESEIRRELLNIQSRMVEEYGSIANTLDLINGSYSDIYAKLVDIAQDEIKQWEKDNKKTIKNYEKGLSRGKIQGTDLYKEGESSLKMYGATKLIKDKDLFSEMMSLEDELTSAVTSGNESLIKDMVDEVYKFRQKVEEKYLGEAYFDDLMNYVEGYTAQATPYIKRSQLAYKIENLSSLKESASKLQAAGINESTTMNQIDSLGLTEDFQKLAEYAEKSGLKVEDLNKVLVELGYLAPDLSNSLVRDVYARIKALENKGLDNLSENETEELANLNNDLDNFLDKIGSTRENFLKFSDIYGNISISGTLASSLEEVNNWFDTLSNTLSDLESGLISASSLDAILTKFPEFITVLTQDMDDVSGYLDELKIVKEQFYKAAIEDTLRKSTSYTEQLGQEMGANYLFDTNGNALINNLDSLDSVYDSLIKNGRNITAEDLADQEGLLNSETGEIDSAALSQFYRAKAGSDFIEVNGDSLETMESWYENYIILIQEYGKDLDTYNAYVDKATVELYNKTVYMEKLQDEKKQIESAYGYVEHLIDKQIEKLQEANEEREKAIRLMELEDALAKARENKVKVYREGQGFVYEEDVEAVKNAQKDLEEYLDEQALQNQIDALEDIKKLWTELIEKADVAKMKKSWEDLFGLDVGSSMLVQGISGLETMVQNLGNDAAYVMGILNGTIDPEVNFSEGIHDKSASGVGNAEIIKEDNQNLDDYNKVSMADFIDVKSREVGINNTFWQDLFGTGEANSIDVHGNWKVKEKHLKNNTYQYNTKDGIKEMTLQEMFDNSLFQEGRLYYHPDPHIQYFTLINGVLRKVTSAQNSNGKTVGYGDTTAEDKENFTNWFNSEAILGYASGTMGISYSQIALVGERGPELTVLPQGTGVITNQTTKNLMAFGENPNGYISRYLSNPSIESTINNGNADSGTQYIINGMVVHANDANEFITSIQTQFKTEAIKSSTNRKK